MAGALWRIRKRESACLHRHVASVSENGISRFLMREVLPSEGCRCPAPGMPCRCVTRAGGVLSHQEARKERFARSYGVCGGNKGLSHQQAKRWHVQRKARRCARDKLQAVVGVGAAAVDCSGGAASPAHCSTAVAAPLGRYSPHLLVARWWTVCGPPILSLPWPPPVVRSSLLGVCRIRKREVAVCALGPGVRACSGVCRSLMRQRHQRRGLASARGGRLVAQQRGSGAAFRSLMRQTLIYGCDGWCSPGEAIRRFPMRPVPRCTPGQIRWGWPLPRLLRPGCGPGRNRWRGSVGALSLPDARKPPCCGHGAGKRARRRFALPDAPDLHVRAGRPYSARRLTAVCLPAHWGASPVWHLLVTSGRAVGAAHQPPGAPWAVSLVSRPLGLPAARARSLAGTIAAPNAGPTGSVGGRPWRDALSLPCAATHTPQGGPRAPTRVAVCQREGGGLLAPGPSPRRHGRSD